MVRGPVLTCPSSCLSQRSLPAHGLWLDLLSSASWLLALPADGWLLPACLLPLPTGCTEAEVGAPAPALNQAVVRAGMADLVQGVTEEMVGQNKHWWAGEDSRGLSAPSAWPLAVGCRAL